MATYPIGINKETGEIVFAAEPRPFAIPLKVHVDQRGWLFEIWREDLAAGMGLPVVRQVYLSAIRPGVIKGWQLHHEQWGYLCCIQGEVMVATFKTEVEEGETFYLTPRTLQAIVIPPEWWFGFQNIALTDALLINCASEVFRQDQSDKERRDPWSMNPDVWLRRDG